MVKRDETRTYLYNNKTNSYTKLEVNFAKMSDEISENLILAKSKTPVKISQAWWNSNLMCTKSMPIHIKFEVYI